MGSLSLAESREAVLHCDALAECGAAFPGSLGGSELRFELFVQLN